MLSWNEARILLGFALVCFVSGTSLMFGWDWVVLLAWLILVSYTAAGIAVYCCIRNASVLLGRLHPAAAVTGGMLGGYGFCPSGYLLYSVVRISLFTTLAIQLPPFSH
jgi:predicted membrane protein